MRERRALQLSIVLAASLPVAAGHVPRTSFFSRRLQWHELSDDGRHHLKRALIAFGAFFALCLGGVMAGVVAAFVMRV